MGQQFLDAFVHLGGELGRLHHLAHGPVGGQQLPEAVDKGSHLLLAGQLLPLAAQLGGVPQGHRQSILGQGQLVGLQMLVGLDRQGLELLHRRVQLLQQGIFAVGPLQNLLQGGIIGQRLVPGGLVGLAQLIGGSLQLLHPASQRSGGQTAGLQTGQIRLQRRLQFPAQLPDLAGLFSQGRVGRISPPGRRRSASAPIPPAR